MTKPHFVHAYTTVRIKVAVDAKDHDDAMTKAEAVICERGFPIRLIPIHMAVRDAEFADEITGFLVDEADDPECEKSRSYHPDHKLYCPPDGSDDFGSGSDPGPISSPSD